MLIILGGLPGVGKSTIAKLLAQKLQAAYLRIDSIEHVLAQRCSNDPSAFDGPEGYLTAYAIAQDNLVNGITVIADSVNAIEITRCAWRNIATSINKLFVEIEIVCSDKTIHQQRVEERSKDLSNFILPNWNQVINRAYEPWLSKQLTIDTAILTKEEAVQHIITFINNKFTATN